LNKIKQEISEDYTGSNQIKEKIFGSDSDEKSDDQLQNVYNSYLETTNQQRSKYKYFDNQLTNAKSELQSTLMASEKLKNESRYN